VLARQTRGYHEPARISVLEHVPVDGSIRWLERSFVRLCHYIGEPRLSRALRFCELRFNGATQKTEERVSPLN